MVEQGLGADLAYSLRLPAVTSPLGWSRPATVACASQLVPTTNSYWEAMRCVPRGYRISALEELAPTIEDADAERVGMLSPCLEELLSFRPALWEWTQVLLRAPDGEAFRTYADRDPQGRLFYRADYWIGDRLVAPGIRVPHSDGAKVVAWDPVLRLPSMVSENVGVRHRAHFYFDPSSREVAILLRGESCPDGQRRCLAILATLTRYVPVHTGATRLFCGELPDMPTRLVTADART